VPRKAFDLRVTDAMACGMAIRIGHIRDVLAKIKANGGARPVEGRCARRVEDTIRNVFVKDPNGLNLELVARRTRTSRTRAVSARKLLVLQSFGSGCSPIRDTPPRRTRRLEAVRLDPDFQGGYAC
jgi:hypothetical protein